MQRGLTREFPRTRFILPTAPVQPVTINGGMRMTSWFDILCTSCADLLPPAITDANALQLWVVQCLHQIRRASPSRASWSCSFSMPNAPSVRCLTTCAVRC
jgi:hypothetical protein